MSTRDRRAIVARELAISDDESVFEFPDYAGRSILASGKMLCGKLAVDIPHVRYAGWVRRTLLDPIEVWDRQDRPNEHILKRHYLSAYRDSSPVRLVSYLAVAVESDSGNFVTAYPKDGSLDTKRNGALIHLSYRNADGKGTR